MEIGARLAQPALVARVPAYHDRPYERALVTADPVFGWSNKPGAHAVIPNALGEGIDYRLNRLGWRDKEFNPIEMPGNALLLGDSFAFGVGVREQNRFSERLEENFRGLDVWNLAVMGYAPDQQLLLAERWLPPVPWRFVLLQLSSGSLAGVAGHVWRGIHSLSGIPAAVEPPFSRSLVSGISEGWNLLVYAALQSHPPSAQALQDGLERLLFSVSEIAKLANLRHVPMIVMQASDWGEPVYGPKVAEAYRSGVVALARAENFSLMEAGPQELFPDGYWTAAAHRHVGDLLSPEVYKILFPAPAPAKPIPAKPGRGLK